MVSPEEKLRRYMSENLGMNQKITKLIEKRLELGYKKYGKENIASDGRDFIQESLEEILDCCVYISSKLIEIKEKNNG